MAQPPGPYQTADAQRVDNESVKGELRDTSLVESKNVIRMGRAQLPKSGV
jgi:hypothetical protein